MKKYFILFLFILSAKVSAQNTSGPYQIKWVNDIQGLSNLTVSNAILDDNGIVWIATDLGLYRYNGTIVEPVISKQFSELTSKRIISIFKDNYTGKIGFSTYPNGNSYTIKNGEINEVNKSRERIFVELLLTSNNPFFNSFLNFYSKYGSTIDAKEYKDFLLTKEQLYVLLVNNLYFLEKNGSYSSVNTRNNNFFICHFNDSVITIGNKIGLVSNKQIIYDTITVDSVLKNFISTYENLNKPNAIIKSNDNYYLNFNSKIYEISYCNNKLSTTFLFELKNQDIQRLSYDPKQRLFLVGTINSGLALVHNQNFNTISKKENAVEYAIINHNNTWYSYNGWTHNISNNSTIDSTIQNQEGNMRFLLQYNNNFYYETKEGALISILDRKTKANFNVKEINYLTGFTYLNKKLWIVNAKKCAYLKNSQLVFDSLVTSKLSKYQDINAISSYNNQLIFATTKGVFLHKPFSNQFNYFMGLEKVNARYIKHIDKNSFWVGCYGEGLFLVHKNKTFKVKDTNILINTTHAIEEDKSGNLWISTNNGLLTVNKKKAINNSINNKAIECYLYTKQDGLPTNEFNGGSTFPSVNSKGIIGFPSMKGFVWFNPEMISKNIFSGDINATIVVNNKLLKSQKKDYFIVPVDTDIIDLFIKFGYYFNRKNISVFYKFQNQKYWNKIESNRVQIPRYKSGIQILKIKIHTHGTEETSDIVKSFKIDFQKRFHEVFWFRVLIFISIILIIFISYLVGTLIANRNKQKLEKKIEEKTIILIEALQELEESKKSLIQSLAEKDMLIKEVHHRVKNNLQLIMSMLKIQARRKNYDSIFDFLNKGESRINAMALIHQRLYQVDETLNNIDLQAYIKDLTDSIILTFIDNEKDITINLDCQGIMINLTTAIPIGLIINEIITNSLKYAFQNKEKGIITIKISKLHKNHFELIVEDNGIGFDKKENHQNSFGLELINLLVQQLKGTITLDSSNKTKFIIVFTQIDNQAGVNNFS